MATYRVRNLFCIPCDEPVRARNLLVGEAELLSRCPGCDGELSDIDLKLPEPLAEGGIITGGGWTIIGGHGPEPDFLHWPGQRWPIDDDPDLES